MKHEFIDIYKRYVKREGAAELLEWLNKQDFFLAPASSKYHLCEEAGLLKHSINVYKRLRIIYMNEKDAELTVEEEEKIAIVALLHDVCKINLYKQEKREDKTTYRHNDEFPYGHGEKSVFVISKFMKLTDEEAMAIRWHMGFSDNNFKAGGQEVGKAFRKYPLALMVHIADLQATFIDEV